MAGGCFSSKFLRPTPLCLENVRRTLTLHDTIGEPLKVNVRRHFRMGGRGWSWVFLVRALVSQGISLVQWNVPNIRVWSKNIEKCPQTCRFFRTSYPVPHPLPDICLVPLYKTRTLLDKCPDFHNRQDLPLPHTYLRTLILNALSCGNHSDSQMLY